MSNLVIYMKIEQNIIVHEQKIQLQQITQLQGTDEQTIEKLKELVILNLPESKKKKYAVSVLTLIKQVQTAFPEVILINMGVNDFVIEYEPPHHRWKAWYAIKVIFVSFAVFFGSAFTIMTFNNDVGVHEVFELFYSLVTGTKESSFPIVEIAYGVGLPLGIMIFFNHFSRRRMRADPTPLQVQLRLYEENENKAIIENASREGEEL